VIKGRRILMGRWGSVVICFCAVAWFSGCDKPTREDNNPQLSVTPDTLAFGVDKSSLSLTIENAGDGILDWSIQLPSEGWVSANQVRGEIVSRPISIDIRIDRERAPEGQQEHVLVVTGSMRGRQEIILTAQIIKSKLAVLQDTLSFGPDLNDRDQALTIKNEGTGVLNWSIARPTEDWLQVVPLQGSTAELSSNIIVTVDPFRTTRDSIYWANLRITSDGGDAAIPVRMIVEGRTPEPHIHVSPISLGYGATSIRQSIGISNTGGGELVWEAVSGQSWLRITPTAGSTTSGTSQVAIEVDRSQLSPGEHPGSIDITSNGGSASIPVTVSVPTPVLALDTREIDFRSDLDAFTLKISNIGTGDLKWSFAHNSPWLNIEPSQGTTGQVAIPVVFTVSRQGLEAKTYDALVNLNSNSISEPVAELQIKMQVSEQPILDVMVDSLIFGSEVEELSLTVSNINNGILTWEIETDQSWIATNPPKGEIIGLGQELIDISVTRGGLVSGLYQAQLTISSNGGRKIVPASVEIPHNPLLSIDRQALNFGEKESSQTIVIRNTGTGRLSWNVQEDTEWLAVSPSAGTTLDEEDTLTFVVDRSNLGRGTFSATVKITSEETQKEVVVEMVVRESSGSKPVANAGPDQVGNMGDVIYLDGSGSSDPDGDELTFSWELKEGLPIELNSTNSPTIVFSPSSPGSYTFILVVSDRENESDPDEIVVTINESSLPAVEVGGAEIIGEIEEHTGGAEIVGEVEDFPPDEAEEQTGGAEIEERGDGG
jgi:hypothetical protein